VRRAVVLAALVSALVPSVAFAYEDRAAVALELGWGFVGSNAPLPQHGLVSGVSAGFGLGDTWELRVDAAYGLHPELLHRLRTSAEIVYLVDILQVVPFVGLGTGATVSFVLEAAPDQPEYVRPDFELHVTAGFDVLLDRDWTVGLVVRPIFQLTSAEADLFYLTITARLQFLIDLR
jgi:hypothetical protein